MSCPTRKQIANRNKKKKRYENQESKSNNEQISEEENQERINKLKEAGLLKEQVKELVISKSITSDKEKKS